MSAALPSVAPDIGPILALLRKTRLLLRSSWGTVGVGLTIGLAFAALAVATVADVMVPLVGPWLRLAGLVLFVVPTAVVFIWKGLLPVARRLRNVEVARRIESNIPGMHSRLVSCMDLAGRQSEVSPAFYRKLVSESLDRIGTYRSTSVVDFRALRQALVIALVGVGLFGLLWLGLGERLTTALARVVQPFADIPPASDVAYVVEPGTTRVLSGEDITFTATATRGEPEELTVELTGQNACVRYPLEKGPDRVWRKTLRGLSAEKGFETGFTFRVHGGRTWTREHRIDWAARPVIVETLVRVHFPEYMAIPDPRFSPPNERDVTGPAGSRVVVSVAVEGEVASGDIQLLEARVKPIPWPAFPGFLFEREHVVAGTYPLEPVRDNVWSTSFPLHGAGKYRIELRNGLGHATKPASEQPRYKAVADQPPVVHLERPGTDLVLSKPDKVPLQVLIRDDYGLLDLWLAVQKDGEATFARAVKLKEYAPSNPPRADGIVTTLDLTPGGFNLKAGDTLRYRVEVRDRRPDAEPVVSRDFAVRIAEDADAADKRLEAFEKGQDTFRDKLAHLIAEQKKIKQKIDQVQSKYDALNSKVQTGIAEAKAKSKDVPPPKLDGQDARDMEALRSELADLSGQEQKNVAAGARLDQELRNLAAQAKKTPLLNGAIDREWQNLASQFKASALDPLQDLAARLQQGADPAQAPPDLKDTKGKSDRVQKNLESLKGRMDALADAQKGLKTDADKALAKLRDDLVKEQGRMTARDLEELKEFLKELREELARLQGKQEDLADRTRKAPDRELPEIEKKQLALDELLKKDLDLAKKILERERAKRMKKQNPSDHPFTSDPKERRTAPKEDDAPPAGPTKKDGTDADDPFKPALNGEREKLDPRFDKKLRPTPKKGDKRDELHDHQMDNLHDLDAAQKALHADEQTLEQMIQSLLDAAQKGPPEQSNNPNRKGPADDLMSMLRSDLMKAAMEMARRARPGRPGQPQPGDQPPTGSAAESLMGNAIGAAGILDELDPRTRATVLQLPPRVREELLQGMKSQGPEGYQKFIQDYFRRLSGVPK